jgi:hypothetical protein
MANAAAEPEKNVQSEREVKKVVGDYPDRPDSEALTKEQKTLLEERGLA